MPVLLSQRELFPQSRLINLEHPDSVGLQLQRFLPYGKANLEGAFLQGNIFSGEGPVQNSDRACEHPLYRPVCKALSIYGIFHCHRPASGYISPDNRRLYASGSVGLYPGLICKQKTIQAFSKILYHIIALIFSVNQNVQTGLLLQANTLLDLFPVIFFILLLSNLSLFKGKTVGSHLLCLWKGADGGSRQQRQMKGLLLYLLSFLKCWKAGKILISQTF